MTKQQDEQFSALIDGELDTADRDRLLDQLSSDPESRKRWHRYHLINDTLHSSLPDTINPEFSRSVMSAIEDEPAILSPHPVQSIKHKSRSPVTKRVAGMAIAATVAAVAVLSVQNNFQPEQGPQLATMPSSDEFVRIAKQKPAPVATRPGVTRPGVTRSGAPAMRVSTAKQSSAGGDRSGQSSQQLKQQLYQYIVNHNQRVSGGQFQGIVPYARIVVSPGPAHLPGTASRGQAQQ